MRLRIAAEARADLRDIATYIALDNPARAKTFIAELSNKIRTAAQRPMSFPARDDWKPGLRAALHRPYLIVFRIGDGFVEVLRVLHGARNVAKIIRED